MIFVESERKKYYGNSKQSKYVVFTKKVFYLIELFANSSQTTDENFNFKGQERPGRRWKISAINFITKHGALILLRSLNYLRPDHILVIMIMTVFLYVKNILKLKKNDKNIVVLL